MAMGGTTLAPPQDASFFFRFKDSDAEPPPPVKVPVSGVEVVRVGDRILNISVARVTNCTADYRIWEAPSKQAGTSCVRWTRRSRGWGSVKDVDERGGGSSQEGDLRGGGAPHRGARPPGPTRALEAAGEEVDEGADDDDRHHDRQADLELTAADADRQVAEDAVLVFRFHGLVTSVPHHQQVQNRQ